MWNPIFKVVLSDQRVEDYLGMQMVSISSETREPAGGVVFFLGGGELLSLFREFTQRSETDGARRI